MNNKTRLKSIMLTLIESIDALAALIEINMSLANGLMSNSNQTPNKRQIGYEDLAFSPNKLASKVINPKHKHKRKQQD